MFGVTTLPAELVRVDFSARAGGFFLAVATGSCDVGVAGNLAKVVLSLTDPNDVAGPPAGTTATIEPHGGSGAWGQYSYALQRVFSADSGVSAVVLSASGTPASCSGALTVQYVQGALQ